MIDRKELLRDVHLAFAGVERVSDARMFEPEQDYLWVEALRDGTGPWSEVPASAISLEYHALTAVTPEGFRFFLPAYMCWVLTNAPSDSNAIDHTIYALDLSVRDAATTLRMRERFSSLSSLQRIVVTGFLTRASGKPESIDAPVAERALASYWGTYEGT